MESRVVMTRTQLKNRYKRLLKCFKCGERGHTKTKCSRMADDSKYRDIICLGCRQKGHPVRNCTQNSNHRSEKISVRRSADSHYNLTGNVLCFNCGENSHTLKQCQHPRSGSQLPFATCFICKQTGHISSQCDQNKMGIFPHGGRCHRCGSKDHLLRHCSEPIPEEVFLNNQQTNAAGKTGDALDDDFVDACDDEIGFTKQSISNPKKQTVEVSDSTTLMLSQQAARVVVF